MPTAYIARLKRELNEEAVLPQAASRSIQQRIIEWHNGLPAISRNRPFAMSELETALSTQGKYLSPALLSLGWQRKRQWVGSAQYPRFWLPPAD